MKLRIVSALAAAALFCCGITEAQVPHKLNYQGFLTSPSGAPVNSAGLQMVFNIYNVATLGAPLHTETQTVTVSNGIFNVLLGTSTALTLPFDAQYYLGVTPGLDPEMSPRQPLAASPYAIRAATAESADALATGGAVGQVFAGTGGAPAWTGSPAFSGNVTVSGSLGIPTASTSAILPTKLNVVANSPKATVATTRALAVTSNDAAAPFALDVKVVGAPALVDRGIVLQTTDWNTADGGNLLLQPQGGNVGVGTFTTPASKLTVAGRIESTSGGVKFPDGTTQTTAATGGGTLAGDVTGPQSTTVVALVGGVSAANVAAGVNLANAATNANTASTLVKRDASGNLSAGTITAAGDLNLAATNAAGTTGVINQGASRLHSFGSANFFAGTGAGNFSMTGGNNTGVGNSALAASASGGQNTATGSLALPANTGGGQNTASGYSAMLGNMTGGNNAAFGASALQAITGGNFNTAIGGAALANVGGNSSNNIGIGFGAGSNHTSGDANIDIGNAGVAGESNVIRIGTSQTDTYLTGVIHGNGSGLTNVPVTIANGSITSAMTGTGAAQFVRSVQFPNNSVTPGSPFTIDTQVFNSIPASIAALTTAGGTVFTLGATGTYVLDYEMSLSSAGSVGVCTGPTAGALALDTNSIAGSSTATTWIHGRTLVATGASPVVVAICPVVGTASVTTAGTAFSSYLIRLTVQKI